MRITLRNDSASKGLSSIHGNPKWRRGLTLQVIGAGTVWYATERAPLENTDATGTPTSGNSLAAAQGSLLFENWEDDLWLRGSAIGVLVEVQANWRDRGAG